MTKHIIFLVLYSSFYNVFSSEILMMLLILHCSIGLIDSVRNKELSLIAVYYATVLLTSFSNILLLNKVGTNENTIYTYIAPAFIPLSAFIWCIGNSFIFIGYELVVKKSFTKINVELNKKYLKHIFFIVLGLNLLGLTGNELNFSFLGGGGAKIITLLCLISIMIFARLWKKENNNTYRMYAIILCVTQTFLALKTSYLRSNIILPSLSIFGGYFLGLGSLRYLFTYRVIPFLAIFLAFSLIFKSLANNREHFIDAVTGNLPVDASTQEEINQHDKEKGGLLDRMSNLAQISNCVKLVNLNGFYLGTASAPLITALVPRVLWKDKPQIRLGVWFALEIGAAYVDLDGHPNNSINMTIPGELYLDFGWPGVILGCFGLGLLLAMFWNAASFDGSAYNITGTMWGGYMLLTAVQNFTDLQIVITFFSTYMSFYIIKKIFRK